MKATLTSKGQLTIPIEIRRRLNLKAGHVLEFDESSPFLKASRVIAPEAWDQFRAESKKESIKNPLAQLSSKEFLEEIRGPVSLPPGENQ